ncbi:AAA family ATPase [Fulvivirga ligni]|uniref:AAA family ATPase n=1 Tax=Fulvivirga ligni TaxID=2904246 RepID=UPI001F3CAE1A|nr:AAA family ATPase [Fulvivirga ligni]UII19919.1 ATP-binding protein [Fulvivirga ligni]
MLVGIFIRHYKVYKGANYIPFGTNDIENFNLFIGHNGAGKSSILEALDTFFNGREFTVNNGAKRDQCFVAPLFLIKKDELNNYSKSAQEIIPIISEFFFEFSSSHRNYKNYEQFFTQRNNLTPYMDTHYLILAGKSLGQNDNDMITFSNELETKLKNTLGDDYKIKRSLNTLKQDLLSNYTYIYIPVETSIQDFLRLEAKGMQDLMSQSIRHKIEETLNKKFSTKSVNSKRTRKLNALDIINDDLEFFIEKVEKTIQNIDADYDFQLEFKSKKKLTANHLTDVIIDSFFSKRRLRKSEKVISSLSAGERKKALIDIAYSFLTQDDQRKNNIILAIDEPESSLHISMCYDQFERLQNLSSNYHHQLLITTHWYGSLPILEKGNLFHIHNNQDLAPIIKEFSFKNYFEERREHPEDIQFKSFFDLASAIISSMRTSSNNWIIVESEEDKDYLKKYLSCNFNVKILPVGGCTIVKLLYEYLYLPISQKSDSKDLTGKIFCLIDTDLQGITMEIPEESKNGILKIRRLQVNNHGEVDLVRINDNISSPTEIEEALEPQRFYNALDELIKLEDTDSLIHNTWQLFAFDPGVKSSFIKGDSSIIYQTTQNNKTTRENKIIIIDYIESNKKLICKKYCSLETQVTPGWIKEIEQFFMKA